MADQGGGAPLSSVEVFVMPHSEAAAIRMAVRGPCHNFLSSVLGLTA